MNKRRTNKSKSIPYIEVDGIENQYLDAALLLSIDEGSLNDVLRGEFKILKKSGITPIELKNNKYIHVELVKMISPNLLENYTFYNFLANKWNNNYEALIKEYIAEDYSDFTKEKWNERIHQLIKDSNIPVSMGINFFRFHNNGEFKDLVGSLLETYSLLFYRESGIQIEGTSITLDEERAAFFENEVGESNVVEVQYSEKNVEEKLRIASELITNVADQLGQFEEIEELKSLYTSEKEKNADLLSKLEVALQDLKGNTTQQKSLLKENKALSKNVNTLTGQLDQAKKDSSKLSISLGEIRKENNTLSKEIVSLENKVTTLQKNQNLVEKKITKEVKQDYEVKLRLLRDNHQQEIASMEKELVISKKQIEENLQTSLIKEMEEEIESLKKDMFLIEEERRNLLIKIQTEQLNSKTALDSSGINEEEIELFIDFDNKPTRN